MVHTVAYGIPSWGLRKYTARKEYTCRNCGGAIPVGVPYLRSVERLGPRKFKDPLRNVHFHYDCMQKWYVPEERHRLKQLSSLRQQEGGAEGSLLQLTAAVAAPGLGELSWQLPPALVSLIANHRDGKLLPKVPAELSAGIEIVLTALVGAAGKRKRSKQVSNLLNELKQLTDSWSQPEKPRKR